MDVNIVLLCQYGASTGIVAQKIEDEGKKRGINAIVNAYSISELGKVIDKADVVMLGPQVRFQQKKLLDTYGDKNVPIVTMSPVDYGRGNAKALLDQALAAVEKNQ